MKGAHQVGVGVPRPERVRQVQELKAQGLNGLQIAARMGISRSHAYELLADPSGNEARRRKARADGVCMDCGGRTANGGSWPPPKRCSPCAHTHERAMARWTPETVAAAMRDWAARHGRQPTAPDWLHAGPDHPAASTVVYVCGWAQALRLAGFAPLRALGAGATGGPGGLTEDILLRTIRVYEDAPSNAEAARRLGITPTGVTLRLERAGYTSRKAGHIDRKGRWRGMARSTPLQVAQREMERLKAIRERLEQQLADVKDEESQWQAVLGVVSDNGTEPVRSGK